VLVFDTHFTPDAALTLLLEIQKISGKPVRYLVNSHFHPDHSHGNQAFPNAPRILGSTNARRDMLQKDLPSMSRALAAAQGQIEKMKQELLQAADSSRQAVLRTQIAERQKLVERMSRQKVLPPVMTVDDGLDLEDRAQPLQLLYLGRGHTDGDLVLFLPREKIAFAGDLFFNSALPNTQDAFVLDWIQTLKELLKLDVETIVPGHGAVGTRDDLKNFLRYLEELKEWVEPAVARGDSIEQVLRDVQLPSRYAAYDFQNFFPHNLQRIYLELKALHPAPPPPATPDAAKKPAD
jgi:glyoxylase-like metal-dependent hydrolase (beta-lactamase superfamily II)